MRARLDLPVVDTDAAQRAGRRGVLEGDDGVIADRSGEDVSEDDRRPAGAGEGEAEPAAFAGVVERDRRVAEAGLAILPGVGEGSAGVGLAGRTRPGDVALVEPGREHATVRVDGGDFEALAGRVRRDRPRPGEGGAAVAGAGEEGAAVEVLVLEDAEGDDRVPLGSTAMRARASGPQSRFMGSGVTVTGAEKVLPRSVERSTTMRSAIGRANHSAPSGAKAGAAVKASGVLPALPC